MDRKVKYLHALEQLSGELRDTADEMLELARELTQAAECGASRGELTDRYADHLATTDTSEIITRLNTLVHDMKTDTELQPTRTLEPDLIICNSHALRLCQAQLSIVKLLSLAKSDYE